MIAIGADHRGYKLKEQLKKQLPDWQWSDVGAFNQERSDYPVYARLIAQEVVVGGSACGVALCGSGVGMAIALNRQSGVFAAVAHTPSMAAMAKEHDNVNVLVVPADSVDLNVACEIIKAWNQAQFIGGRYKQRLDMIDDYSYKLI
ncbi:RpiB/LacA/LacB family sugar-phosphate isomerase [bacterium]|nr:RpiB/LacA/LacB family sugar-phosphate isomerase [bacterium]